MTEKLF